MTARLILAIDQGTSATKCLLVDEAGAVVARGGAALGETHPQPGWVEQDAEAIWRSVRDAVRAALADHDPAAVVAIGLSSQRESLVMWDRRDGRPLAPVLSWQDQRTAAACEAMRTPEIEDLVMARSGLPLDPMFSALKAKWLLDAHDPDRTRAKAGQIALGTVDSWLLSRFGGDHVVEAGNASRTQLMAVRRVGWDADLLDLFGIPDAALPRIVASTGPFPAASGLDPLPPGVPVAAVMGDSHAALFAHGGFEPGAVKATYGTGSSVMGLIPRPETLAAGLCLTIGWMTERPAYAAEGNIRAAGSTLRWVAGLLEVSTDDLAALAADADNGGVSLVPGFTGLGAPWWDRSAIGLIAGLTLGSERRHLARAAVESIAHQVADVVEGIDRSVGRVSRLHTDGGPTRNASLMQLQADLLDRPVTPSVTAELSALGVAHLAAVSCGLWSWDRLTGMDRDRHTFLPLADADWRRAERTRWRTAVARARGQAAGQPWDGTAAAPGGRRPDGQTPAG